MCDTNVMLIESAVGSLDIPHGKEVNPPVSSLEAGSVKLVDGDTTSNAPSSPVATDVGTVFDRRLVVGGEGNYLHLDDGREILDACGGAAVAVSTLPRPENPIRILLHSSFHRDVTLSLMVSKSL